MSTPYPDQSPPHDLAAERAVLGACLLPEEKDAVECAAKLLAPRDFCVKRHQVLFAAIASLHKRGEPVDVVTVKLELERCQKIKAAVSGG